MYLEFEFFSYVGPNVYFHASWPSARRARPDRIPVVCFEIVWSLWSWITIGGNTTKNISEQSGLRSGPKFWKGFKLLEIMTCLFSWTRTRSETWNIFLKEVNKSLQITNTAKYHSTYRVDKQACWHKYWVCDQVRDYPVCSATETTCGIEILPEVGLSVTISTDKYAGFDIIAVWYVPLCCSLAAGTFYTNGTEKSSFLAAISHTMNFLKDDGRVSFFPNNIILL